MPRAALKLIADPTRRASISAPRLPRCRQPDRRSYTGLAERAPRKFRVRSMLGPANRILSVRSSPAVVELEQTNAKDLTQNSHS